MNFDDELERRLGERADQTVAEPDLAAIESAAAGRRSRRRRAAAVGTVAVTALAVVGIMVVTGNRSESDLATSDVTTSDVATSDVTTSAVATSDGAESAAIPVTEAPADTDGTQGSTAPLVGGVAGTRVPSGPSDSSSGAQPDAGDPYAPYIARTAEVYRRAIGDREVVVRRSDVSWGEFFGLEWPAPTGSAEVCMGDHVLLVRDTGSSTPPSVVWQPFELFDDDGPEPTADAPGRLLLEQGMFGEVAIVRTTGPETEIALLNDDGEEVDRAPVVDGLAVLLTMELWSGGPESMEPMLVPVTDGVSGESIPFWNDAGVPSDDFRDECTPGSFPTLPLPPPGAQPADPVAAEAEVRARHALAVDRSVTLEDDPPDLLDDDTGVAEATAEVDAGQFADQAASAVHSIGAFVFTSPDEAWFEYTITTSISELTGRYGVARFNGEVWQITRATICQDLAEAGGECVPDFEVVTPPEPEGWAEVLTEYEINSQLYFEHRYCLPPPFDGGWCIVESAELTAAGEGG